MLRVQGTNTVADIQSLIEAKAGWQLPPDAVLSSGQHRDLPEKSATLDELGIGDCSVVVLSLPVRGGGCAPSAEKPNPEVVFLDVSGKATEAPNPKATPSKRATTGKSTTAVHHASAHVIEAIEKIRSQEAQLAADIKKYQKKPPPGLVATASSQVTDAVGSTLCVVRSLEQQLDEATKKVGDWRADLRDPIIKPLERDLAEAKQSLDATVATVGSWGLSIAPPPTQEANDPAAFAALPMCDAEALTAADNPTMIRVIGAVALLDGADQVPGWMFAAFFKARVETSTSLVQTILKDVDAYGLELNTQLAKPGAAAASARLEHFASKDQAAVWAQLTDDDGAGKKTQLTEAWLADAKEKAVALAVDPTSLAYVMHARYAAGGVSVRLYNEVSDILGSNGIDGECIPGMLKGEARVVFKSASKYKSDTSKCRDLARATVRVGSLADAARVVELVFGSADILVIRCKNRLSTSYDADSTGGYRDIQLLCLVRDADGTWRYAELQVNLTAMLTIKNGGGGGGGGHLAFNKARLIDAFSERTMRHNGSPSDEVFAAVMAGVLMALDIPNNSLTTAQQEALIGALKSPECRVQSLGYVVRLSVRCPCLHSYE